jgi:hypothetical protein
LNVASLPGKINPGKDAIILFGAKICKSCPTGKYLYSLRGRDDILVIVPRDYSKHDIANLKDIFEIQGKIISGDEEVLNLVEKINRCKDLDMANANFHLKFGENGIIGSILVI